MRHRVAAAHCVVGALINSGPKRIASRPRPIFDYWIPRSAYCEEIVCPAAICRDRHLEALALLQLGGCVHSTVGKCRRVYERRRNDGLAAQSSSFRVDLDHRDGNTNVVVD